MKNTFDKHFVVEGEEKIPSIKLDPQRDTVKVESRQPKAQDSKPVQQPSLKVTPPPVIEYKNEITFVDSLAHDQEIKPKKLSKRW